MFPYVSLIEIRIVFFLQSNFGAYAHINCTRMKTNNTISVCFAARYGTTRAQLLYLYYYCIHTNAHVFIVVRNVRTSKFNELNSIIMKIEILLLRASIKTLSLSTSKIDIICVISCDWYHCSQTKQDTITILVCVCVSSVVSHDMILFEIVFYCISELKITRKSCYHVEQKESVRSISGSFYLVVNKIPTSYCLDNNIK